ncbi:hypothetical protein APHNYW_0349 [Anaplasma phagocytophilum str. ApNYW]|nr:hypothetical protein APHNYW_0349 [Anaplasma phagocytophilum str. ApNYW]
MLSMYPFCSKAFREGLVRYYAAFLLAVYLRVPHMHGGRT